MDEHLTSQAPIVEVANRDVENTIDEERLPAGAADQFFDSTTIGEQIALNQCRLLKLGADFLPARTFIVVHQRRLSTI